MRQKGFQRAFHPHGWPDQQGVLKDNTHPNHVLHPQGEDHRLPAQRSLPEIPIQTQARDQMNILLVKICPGGFRQVRIDL